MCVQARRVERLHQLVDDLGEKKAVAIGGNVADPNSARRLVQATVKQFGRLDSIIVNAGIGLYGGILDASDEELQAMMRTNIEGTVWAVRSAVRQFRAQGEGGDVIISSVAGLRGGATKPSTPRPSSSRSA